MKIFYTASYYGKAKYQRYYDLVVNTLEKAGVEVISPEKGNYKNLLSDKIKTKLSDEKIIHSEAIRRGILISDAVIIEASQEDFQLGYETAFAVENKKHVLCLSTNENFTEKMKYRYLQGAKYNEYNIEELIENFIKLVTAGQLSERFNCFLSPTQLNHIRQKAKHAGVNSSEYLRLLISEDMTTN